MTRNKKNEHQQLGVRERVFEGEKHLAFSKWWRRTEKKRKVNIFPWGKSILILLLENMRQMMGKKKKGEDKHRGAPNEKRLRDKSGL